jgi:hypothetical protein
MPGVEERLKRQDDAPEQQAAMTVPVDRLGAASVARSGGEAPDDKPVVVEFVSDGVKIEVAARPSTRPGHGP